MEGVYHLPTTYPQHYPRRDFQRSKVYKWERLEGLINGSPMAQCTALVHKYWALYRPDDNQPPRVLPGRGCRRALGSAWKIQLPVWARKVGTVLHETAHAITPRPGLHGPAWLRIYIEMIEMEGVVDARGVPFTINRLERSARAAGLRIAPMCACPRPQGRREYKSDDETRRKARERVRAWRAAKLRRGDA